MNRELLQRRVVLIFADYVVATCHLNITRSNAVAAFEICIYLYGLYGSFFGYVRLLRSLHYVTYVLLLAPVTPKSQFGTFIALVIRRWELNLEDGANVVVLLRLET